MLSNPVIGDARKNTIAPTMNPEIKAIVSVCPSTTLATPMRPFPTDRAINAVAPTPMAMMTRPMSHIM